MNKIKKTYKKHKQKNLKHYKSKNVKKLINKILAEKKVKFIKERIN